MIKTILMATWCCSVAAGGLFLASPASPLASHPVESEEHKPPPDEHSYTTPMVLVAPIVQEDRVDGYLFSRLVLKVDTKKLKQITLPFEAVMSDIYSHTVLGNPKFDFSVETTLDIAYLKEHFRDVMNARFGSELVHEVYASQVQYRRADQVRAKQELRTVFEQETDEDDAPKKKKKKKKSSGH